MGKSYQSRVKTGIEISVQFTLVATQRELDRVIFGGKCVNNIVVFVILFRLYILPILRMFYNAELD